MSRWDKDVSDDWQFMDRCVDCDQWVMSMFGTKGVRICVSCAVGEPPLVKRLCGCGAELQTAGVLCFDCEQKGVRGTVYMAALDWAQPEVRTELESFYDEVNRRNDENRLGVSVEVPEGVGPRREQGSGHD